MGVGRSGRTEEDDELEDEERCCETAIDGEDEDCDTEWDAGSWVESKWGLRKW